VSQRQKELTSTRWGGLRRIVAGVALTALAVGGLSAITLASPKVAEAAESPSQQWLTGLSGTTVGGGTMSGAFGATGIGFTATATGRGTSATLPRPNNASAALGNPYNSPDAPSSAVSVGLGTNNATVTSTIRFTKPVIAPMLHIQNVDASRLTISGTTTTGAPLTTTRVSGNSVFTVNQNNVINASPRTAANPGCRTDAGGNPSGSCGSVRLGGASGLVSSFTMTNTESGLGGDGWSYTMSFPTAPLTKQFSPSRIAAGATSKLTFRIANPANEAQPTLTPLDFTDDLPAGVTLKNSTVTDNGSCGTPTYGDLAAGGMSVTAGAISVDAGATCEITVNVTASEAGSYTNDNSNLSTSIANLVPNADTTLVVGTPKYTVAKAVSSDRTAPGDTVTYTVAVKNTGDVDYTDDFPASFTDDLSKVFDDATYVDGSATEGATVSGNTLSWSGALAEGSTKTVSYQVKVSSPDTGDHNLTNTVTPNGPGGTCATSTSCTTSSDVADFSAQKTVDRTTVVPGQNVTYTVTLKNTGKAAFTTAKPAKFTDDLSQVTDDATYNDDATEGATVDGDTLSWSGPLAVGATKTITYSFTVNDPDTGDAKLINSVIPVGGTCAPGACITNVPQGSYTTTKTVDAASAIAGDTVTYTVTVRNTGSIDYTDDVPATFTDDLSKVLDDATYVDGSATSGATVSGSKLSWAGPLATGATQTVSYQVEVKDPVTGNHKLDNSVTPGENGGRCLTVGDCATSTPIADFTTSKTSTPAAVAPGQTVKYTVTVKNTGAVAYTTANPASFTDDLSKVTDDATYNDDATNSATFTGNTLAWNGALGIGDTTTITYTVTVNDPDTGDKVLANTVTPGIGGHCDGCTTTNNVRTATITKTASTPNVHPGDTVTYTVTVTNTGPAAYTSASPATLTDDLSKVLDDGTYVTGSATNGAKVSGTTLTWSGPLEVGVKETITYQVKAGPAGTGDGTLTNKVAGGPGITCEPEGSCVTNTPLQAYTVTKKADATEVVPGSKITYTITVKNTGKDAYTVAAPATFTDDLSKVLDDATYNGDATNSATYDAPTLSWSGPLAVGATETITYSVTVNDPDTGDKILDNAVVTPPDGGCAPMSDSPDCRSLIPSGSYSVTKSADKDNVRPGDTVTYTVAVKNTGKAAYTAEKPAAFRDDLTNVLDDAKYSGDATQGATVRGNTLAWSGPLKVGQTIKVVYSVTVNDPDTGNLNLVNAVVPTISGGSCDPAESCITHTPVRSFTVTKTVSTTDAVKPGDTVRYKVTVKNTGAVAFTTANPASFVDDMSDVLDDATYNSDATHGAKLTGTTLNWAGPLKVGQTIAVTYSAAVKAAGSGNGALVNTVDPPVDGSCDGVCKTSTPLTAVPVPPKPIIPGLAFTGTELVGPGTGLALMLVALGGGLLVVRRRRSTGDVQDNA
jgi:uncharacterized repeat protein (TIGR01451 family)